MKLTLTKEQFEILSDLVFLGNWVVNSHRLPDDTIKKYETLSTQIQKLHERLLPPDEKDLYIDIYDYYMKHLKTYIDDYDNEGCFPVLAQKLAEANYPANPNATKYYNSLNMQYDAQTIYEKELTKKGMSIISIDIPDMDDRLEKCRQLLRKTK